MTATFRLPADYLRIQQVSSFEALVSTRFEAGVNALCWPRVLEGDFEELVQLVVQETGQPSGVTALDDALLSRLRPSAEGALALHHMQEDLRRLNDRGLEPELNCVRGYSRAEPTALVATDVYSFHADRAPFEVDTWLCTYHGAPTEGLRNDQALARVADDATRKALLGEFGAGEGEAFEDFLRDNSYDLHFAQAEGATPWSFGVGCLWRVAVLWPGALVPPCIHRAPRDEPSSTRLLLIG